MSEKLKILLERTNSILGTSKLLQMEAQKEIESEDHLQTNEGPKHIPVLFGKRKESGILETHRGNYKRHWEPSSRWV